MKLKAVLFRAQVSTRSGINYCGLLVALHVKRVPCLLWPLTWRSHDCWDTANFITIARWVHDLRHFVRNGSILQSLEANLSQSGWPRRSLRLNFHPGRQTVLCLRGPWEGNAAESRRRIQYILTSLKPIFSELCSYGSGNILFTAKSPKIRLLKWVIAYCYLVALFIRVIFMTRTNVNARVTATWVPVCYSGGLWEWVWHYGAI